MRLYTFEVDGRPQIGVEVDNQLIDAAAAHQARRAAQPGSAPTADPFPGDMLTLIQAGEPGLAAVREAVAFATQAGASAQGEGLLYPLSDVRLLAPLQRPGKILCSGVNYRGHVDENPGAVLPETPGFFAKLPNAVIGPDQPIVHPRLTEQLDYEVELAVVIGRRMRHTPEAEAMGCIMGYTILHDVSARDVQFKPPAHNQITLGKNFDTFAPMGPCIVTADEIPDPENLRLRTLVNGQLLQNGSNEDWVFPLPRLLAFLSRVMTLEPGDVVTTGTPSGVGVFRKPQIFLKPGDHVVLEIERIGRLQNPVVDGGDEDTAIL